MSERTINLQALHRGRITEALAWAAVGDTVVVTRFGKPYCRIVSLEASPVQPALPGRFPPVTPEGEVPVFRPD